jgi:hypothetical protein
MSDQYGVIVVSGDPRGRGQGCIVSGTPVPGTCMTVLAATEPVGGVFTYEVYNRDADGDRAPVAVLVEDNIQGRIITKAFTTLDNGQLFFPQQGDLLQMLVANISGTADSFAIGDYMIIEDGTGKLIATTGSPQMESFVIMETQSALTTDLHVLCQYTGA